jgi:hypothetical protein
VVALWFLSAAPAPAAECTPETPGPSPKRTARLAELEPNANRVALALNLGGDTSDADDVTLATKRERPITQDPADPRRKEATADIGDSLRDDNDRLDATVSTRATPRRGGTTVGVGLCVDAADQWQAGTFGGTVTIDGPRLKRFAYPMVVTKKWPWWSAFFLILLIVGGYILYAWGRGNAPSVQPEEKGWWRTKFVYFGVSAAGGLLVYWSVYVESQTWGENPPADIAALALATLTGAIAGGTAAGVAFDRINSSGDGDATKDPKERK